MLTSNIANHFNHDSSGNPGYHFFTIQRKKQTYLGVSIIQGLAVLEEWTRQLDKLWKKEEVMIPCPSMTIGDGIEQQAGAICRNQHAWRYQTYVVPKRTDLKDSVVGPWAEKVVEEDCDI